MQYFFTLVVLCVSGQLVHHVNGQCGLVGTPVKRIFQDDAPLDTPETFAVGPEVTGVVLGADYIWFRVELDIPNSQILLFPTEELKNYFDPRPSTGPNLNIKDTQLTCSSGPGVINNIELGIVDTNNMAPEFPAGSMEFTISLPYSGAPINWDSVIEVRDKDYDFANTEMSFSITPTDVVIVSPDYKRVPEDTAQPLDHYNVYFSLKEDVNLPYNGDVILTATNGVHVVPYTIKLTVTATADVSPPQIIELPTYYDSFFPNEDGASIHVATAKDDFSPTVTTRLEGDDPTIVALFDAAPVAEADEWKIMINLPTKILLPILEANSYVIRLTLVIEDDLAQPTRLPLVLQFEEERLKFDLQHYPITLDKVSTGTPIEVGSVTLDPPLTVQFSIAPISEPMNGYLEIDPLTGVISSTRNEDDLVNNNGKVDVFLVTATKDGTVPVTVTVIIYNKPDPSLITTTTTTEETTTECPTESTTICSCTTLEPEPCTTLEPEPCTCPTTTTPCEISSTASPAPCTTTEASSCSPCPPTQPPGSTECPPTTTCPDLPTPLTCPPVDCSDCPNTCQTTEKPSECSNTGLIIGIAVVGAIAVVSTAVAAYFIYKMMTSARDPLKNLTHVENSNGYEKFQNDLERGSRNSVPGDSNLGGHANPLSRESIGNTSLDKSFDGNGGDSLNHNVPSDTTNVASVPKNIYTDPVYAYPTPHDVASKPENSKEPKIYSETKRNKTDSVDGSIYARPISESYASTSEPPKTTINAVEPKVAEPVIEEPKIDYKVVEFGGVELIPSDAEEEIERL